MTPGEGLIWRFYHYGVEWEVIPPLIFLGLGAHTDFGPLLSQPRLIFLGAAAQLVPDSLFAYALAVPVG